MQEDEEDDDQQDQSSTPKTCLDAPEWVDSILKLCCEKRLSDTFETLMTAQDSFCVAAVRGSIQTATNFNECKIHIFILCIILVLFIVFVLCLF